PHNDYKSYKPYDRSTIDGDLTPTLPPPAGKEGCGPVGTIVTIVVAAILTYVAPWAGTFWGSMAAAAIASTAGQLAAVAVGEQKEFSWKSVAISAVSAGVTFGLGSTGVFGTTAGGIAARAALGNALTQGVSVAFNLQDSFSWTAVAAAGAGSLAGSAASNGIVAAGLGGVLGVPGIVALSTFASGSASALVRGGKISWGSIALDAFGNALGSGLLASMANARLPKATLAVQATDELQMSDTGRVPIAAAHLGVLPFGDDPFGEPDFVWGGGKSGYGMGSTGAEVDLGLQGVGTLVEGSELPDPMRTNSYPKVFGDGRAVTVLDAGSGQRIACWRTAETCILPPAVDTSTVSPLTNQAIWESGLVQADSNRLLTDLSFLEPSAAAQNANEFTLNSNGGGQSALSLSDTQRRMNYHAANEAARDAAKLIIAQAIIEDNPAKATAAATNASQQRIDNRSIARDGLSKGGLALSTAVDQTNLPQYYFDKAKLRNPNASEIQIAEKVAEGAARSNGYVNKLGTATKYLGPLGVGYGAYSTATNISNASPADRPYVVAQEAGTWVGGWYGASWGMVGGVALAVALGSNPIGWGILAAGAIGGIAGGVIGSHAGSYAAGTAYKGVTTWATR
ncbi:MAG: hypothetical protein WKG03_21245, partial [Telluria sp.]